MLINGQYSSALAWSWQMQVMILTPLTSALGGQSPSTVKNERKTQRTGRREWVFICIWSEVSLRLKGSDNFGEMLEVLNSGELLREGRIEVWEKEIEKMRKENSETSVTSFFCQKASDGLKAPEFSPRPSGVLSPWGGGGRGRKEGRAGTAPLTLPGRSVLLPYTFYGKLLCNDELLERQNLF